MRAQQFTAPVTAKGVEDTAFYTFNRLVSLNEVGGDPEQFGIHRARVPSRQRGAAAALAAHDARDLHPRQQALRGRARAHRRDLGAAGAVALASVAGAA